MNVLGPTVKLSLIKSFLRFPADWVLPHYIGALDVSYEQVNDLAVCWK